MKHKTLDNFLINIKLDKRFQLLNKLIYKSFSKAPFNHNFIVMKHINSLDGLNYDLVISQYDLIRCRFMKDKKII